MTVKVSKQWSCLSSVLVPSVGDSHMRGMHISCFFRAKNVDIFPVCVVFIILQGERDG